jgi:hypothetical protein
MRKVVEGWINEEDVERVSFEFMSRLHACHLRSKRFTVSMLANAKRYRFRLVAERVSNVYEVCRLTVRRNKQMPSGSVRISRAIARIIAEDIVEAAQVLKLKYPSSKTRQYLYLRLVQENAVIESEI